MANTLLDAKLGAQGRDVVAQRLNGAFELGALAAFGVKLFAHRIRQRPDAVHMM